jgi:hypothetical protein
LNDPRIATLMRALRRRFPGTTLITGPMPDAPESGETLIKVLNAPVGSPSPVEEFAQATIWKLWGDEPWPALVDPVSRQSTAKYYSQHVPKPKRTARRRATAPRKRRRAVAGRA